MEHCGSRTPTATRSDGSPPEGATDYTRDAWPIVNRGSVRLPRDTPGFPPGLSRHAGS